MIRKLIQHKAVKNVGWILGGEMGRKLLVFLVSILTARYLGPDNLGLINYSQAYITFFASVCNLGINSIIIKNFDDHPGQVGTTIGTALLLRGISSILSAAVIIAIVSIVDRDEPLTIIVTALSTIGLLFQVFESFNEWFQWQLRSKYSALATLIAYIAVSAYKITLLVRGAGVKWFALSNSVEFMVLGAFLLLAYRRSGGPKFSVSFDKAKQLLSKSTSFILSGLMISIYASTDKLMIKQMMAQTDVGHYALASSLSVMWTFVLSAIITTMYPGIVRLHASDKGAYEKRNRQLYAIVFYLSVFISVTICVLAEPIIRFLYGEAYLPAIAPLRIVVWYTAFSCLGGARNVWVVCENKQKYLKYLYFSAALINVLLNLLLIPVFGTSGAAAASLLTQISTTVLLPAVIRPLRENAKMMLDAVLLRGIGKAERKR